MIHNMDALHYLDNCQSVRAIFADPPDNLGLAYMDDPTEDKMSGDEYERFLELLMLKAMNKCEIFWLSYYHTHDLTVAKILYNIRQQRPWNWRKIIWRYTFGQYNDKGLSSGYRPILMVWRQDVKPYFDKIRTMSERMRLGDPRASGLRIPDDVWEIPRIVGNSPERRSWHPTQHPEELMGRIVLLSCSYTQTFVDLFAGSGTSGRVCKKLGIPYELVERSATYCSLLESELK